MLGRFNRVHDFVDVCILSVLSPSCVRLFATPWTVTCQAPLSTGFSRQEYWSVLPFPSPEDLPHPGIEPGSPASQAHALLSELCVCVCVCVCVLSHNNNSWFQFAFSQISWTSRTSLGVHLETYQHLSTGTPAQISGPSMMGFSSSSFYILPTSEFPFVPSPSGW